MHPHLEQLLILQERDKKIYQIKEDLTTIPQEASKLKSSLGEKLQVVESAKAAHLTAEKEVKLVELDINTRKDTILKLKTRQGETKRNEEYQMLSHEVDRYSKEVDDLETRELELMETVDAKMLLREEAKERFSDEKALAVERSQELTKRKVVGEKRLESLLSERNKAEAAVDSGALSLYHRIIKNRGVGAVVHVTNSGQCSGCHIKLPPAFVHQVLAGNDIVQCSECSRILYNL